MAEYPVFKERKSIQQRLVSFVWIFFIILIFFYGGLAGWNAYKQWRGDSQAQDIEEQIRLERQAFFQNRLVDAYGGKTPHDTLRMFVDAVERGDYDLASRYFILEKWDAWKQELEVMRHNRTIISFLTPLVSANTTQGEYSRDGSAYSLHVPILVSFIKYPNGIWKLAGI